MATRDITPEPQEVEDEPGEHNETTTNGVRSAENVSETSSDADGSLLPQTMAREDIAVNPQMNFVAGTPSGEVQFRVPVSTNGNIDNNSLGARPKIPRGASSVTVADSDLDTLPPIEFRISRGQVRDDTRDIGSSYKSSSREEELARKNQELQRKIELLQEALDVGNSGTSQKRVGLYNLLPPGDLYGRSGHDLVRSSKGPDHEDEPVPIMDDVSTQSCGGPDRAQGNTAGIHADRSYRSRGAKSAVGSWCPLVDNKDSDTNCVRGPDEGIRIRGPWRPQPVSCMSDSFERELDGERTYRHPKSTPRGPGVYREHEHKSSLGITKLATFDGEGNWQDYLVHFELVSKSNKWDDESKALKLATALRGRAQGILSDLTMEEQLDYRCLVKVLTDRFQPEDQAEIYKAQIKGRLRKKDETLPELAQEIKRLVRLAYPGAPHEIRQQLGLDYLIEALNDSDMEWAIHQGKARTISDAVRIALEFEAFQTGRRKRSTTRAAIRCQKEVEDNNVKDLEDRLTDLTARVASLQEKPKAKNSESRKCYYCDKVGHIKRDCRKMKSDRETQSKEKSGN